jgi:hypothetical protein
LLLFVMRGLALRPLRWPSFDYREALWRVGVTFEGENSWLALRCDIDSGLVRAFGRRIVRYPTRSARFEVTDDTWKLHATEGTLSVRFERDGAGQLEAAGATKPRRTFVLDRGRPFEIPWEEVAAPTRTRVRAAIVDDSLSRASFGASVRWQADALALEGRIHMCGVARAI